MFEMMMAGGYVKPSENWVDVLALDFSQDGVITDTVSNRNFVLNSGVTVAGGKANFTGAGTATLDDFGKVDFVGCDVEIEFEIDSTSVAGSAAIFELGRLADNTTSLGYQFPDGNTERFICDVTVSASSWYDAKWTRQTGKHSYKAVRSTDVASVGWTIYRDGSYVGTMQDLYYAGFYRDSCSLSLGGLFRGDYRYIGSLSKFTIRTNRKYTVLETLVTRAIGTWQPSGYTKGVCFLRGPGGGGGAGGNQSLSYKFKGGDGGRGALLVLSADFAPSDVYTIIGGQGGISGKNVNSRVDSGSAGTTIQLSRNGVVAWSCLGGNGGGGSATTQGANGTNGGNGVGSKGGSGGYRADGYDGEDGNLLIRQVII